MDLLLPGNFLALYVFINLLLVLVACTLVIRSTQTTGWKIFFVLLSLGIPVAGSLLVLATLFIERKRVSARRVTS